MVDWLVKLFQDPTVSSLLTAVAVEGGKAIYHKLLCAEKNTPEWQLFNSLDRAFFQTETDLSRKHDTEAIRETFFSELFDFSSAFSIDTLKQVFQDALGRPATDAELKVWVANVVKQIALPEHEVLFRYLQTLHILPNELTQQPLKPSPILTPSASVWDDKNILARDEFIDSLCTDFTEHPRRIQLVGMGGIGKTEILNKLYAKLAAKPAECGFDFIGLVHFSGAIESDLGQQIEPPKGYLGMQGAEAALRYLRDVCTEHHVLLLVDDIRAQQPLPKAKDNPLQYLTTLGASVLLASRVPFPQFDQRDVAVLPIEKCIDIFERQYGRTVTDDGEKTLLTKIIEEKAGQNTLIVNRLGGMAKDSGWSIKELFDHLETQQFSIPKGAADDEPLQQEIKKLYILDKDFTPAEISILEAFSIFPAIPLALDLCKEWLSEDAGVEPDECARKLAGLAQKTWLIRHDSEESSIPMYSMHQVVREAVKGQIGVEGSKHTCLINASTDTLNQNTQNNQFSFAAQIIPFTTSIFEEIHEKNKPITILSDAIGNFYYLTATYSLALRWLQIAAALSEEVFGVSHPRTGMAYNNIGRIHHEQGDYPVALKWFFRALEIVEKVSERETRNAAITYNNIAGVYKDLGNYPEALNWFFKALEIGEKVLGKEHPNTATTYNNIAGVYKDLADYSKALDWYFKALVIREKVLGKEHPHTASTYNNIAGVYAGQRNYSKALDWYFKALDIQEKVLGKDHPANAATYNNIAIVYKNHCDYPKALEWYFKALEIAEKVLGKNHPNTATTYNNIAAVYDVQGDYPKALEWYFKALLIYEELLGNEHLLTATTYNNIAGVYDSQGDYSKALKWYYKALLIREKVLGKEPLDTAITYNNITGVYYQQGDLHTALEWFQKALPIFEAKLGPDHPSTKNVRFGIEFITAKLVSTDPSK